MEEWTYNLQKNKKLTINNKKGELLLCVPTAPCIFTSRGKTIKSQEKPQESGLRFIRLGVKPSSMQEAKKDFNAQNVIMRVG